MHLEAIQLVTDAANMVYCHQVDRGWSMEWADDGACIIWYNLCSRIVYC